MNSITIVNSETISSIGSLTARMTPSHAPSHAPSFTGSFTANEIVHKKTLLCAGRATGKTRIVVSLVKLVQVMSPPDHIMIVTSTNYHDRVYGDAFTKASILHKLEEDFVDSIPTLCKQSNHVLLVLEDGAFSIASRNSAMINKIHQLTSIPNLTLFVICQYPSFTYDVIKDFDVIFFGMGSDVKRLFRYVKTICWIENFASFDEIITGLPLFSFICVKNTKKMDRQRLRIVHEKTSESEDGLAIAKLDGSYFVKYPLIGLIGQNPKINAQLVKNIISCMGSNVSDTNDPDANTHDVPDTNTHNVSDTNTHDVSDTNTQIHYAELIANMNKTAYAEMIANMNKTPYANTPQLPKSIDHLVVITRYNKILYEDLTESIYESPQIIKNILREQQNNDRKHYMIVIDWDRQSMCNENSIRELFFYGRLHCISCIMVSNHPLGLAPDLRPNFDLVFMNAGSNLSTEKRLYDLYFGMFPCFKSFRQVYGKMCETDESFIVVVNKGLGKSITDKIKWFSVTDTLLTKFPQIQLTTEAESKETECDDNKTNAECISELKTRYDDQQGLIKSISVLLEQVNKESAVIKKMIDKLSTDQKF